MSHESYLMLISLELDGLLSKLERQLLHQHLEECAHCSLARTRMQIAGTLLKMETQALPPVDFAERVMKGVSHYEIQQRKRSGLILSLGMVLMGVTSGLILPALVMMLGFSRQMVDWPIMGDIMSYAEYGVVLSRTLAAIAMRGLDQWAVYITSSPAATIVVLVALVLASTCIGLLEALKPEGVLIISRQSVS